MFRLHEERNMSLVYDTSRGIRGEMVGIVV